MPVAVPSGEYTLASSVDLTPAFEKIESETTIRITQPPPDILDRRLGELESGDAEVRNKAAMDLAYFEEEGERVFPALLDHLDDPDQSVRVNVMEAMGYYPDQLRKHSKVFLELLRDRENEKYLRSVAAEYLGRHAPLKDEVRKALEKAAISFVNDPLAQFFMRARDSYRRRVKADKESEKRGSEQ